MRTLVCILVCAGFLAGCSTVYYSSIFRVETTKPKPSDEYSSAPTELIDGSIGMHMGWEWLVRSVATYESNDSTRYERNNYTFTIQQTSRVRPSTAPAVETLFVTLEPVGTVLPVACRYTKVDTVSFGDETRRILRFGSLDIPPEVDTLTIRCDAKDPSAGTEAIEFRMVRYKATFEKFGFRARD